MEWWEQLCQMMFFCWCLVKINQGYTTNIVLFYWYIFLSSFVPFYLQKKIPCANKIKHTPISPFAIYLVPLIYSVTLTVQRVWGVVVFMRPTKQQSSGEEISNVFSSLQGRRYQIMYFILLVKLNRYPCAIVVLLHQCSLSQVNPQTINHV